MTGWPRHARRWSAAEIARDAAAAREEFRRRRFGEPRSRYPASFKEFEQANKWLLPHLQTLLVADAGEPQEVVALLADVLSDDIRSTALRYVGGPPISLDDLKTLADSTLARKAVANDPDVASAIRDVLRAIIDSKRIPWIEANRQPTPRERCGARLKRARGSAARADRKTW